MVDKNIVATIFLKNGQAVRSLTDHSIAHPNVVELAKLYNDSGIDKIIILDLSEDDEEHELNLDLDVKEIIMSTHKDSKCSTKNVILRPYESIVFKIK